MRVQRHAKHPRSRDRRRRTSRVQSKPHHTDRAPPHSQHARAKQSARETKPTIPFHTSSRILLVGEGDLSFSRSLVTSHACQYLTATVCDSPEELHQKYPHVAQNIGAIEQGGGHVRYKIDCTKSGLGLGKGRKSWDQIVFNFPHVGGKSKDINRQVRHNQELLVAFFTNAHPLLSPSISKSQSCLIVTLFEGEPYTLWNIKDLARHCGLEVERSFAFPWAAYPGYQHARTLGIIKGKDGELGGGWKGEERKARMFVFVKRSDRPSSHQGGRRQNTSESETENEDRDESEKDAEKDVDD